MGVMLGAAPVGVTLNECIRAVRCTGTLRRAAGSSGGEALTRSASATSSPDRPSDANRTIQVAGMAVAEVAVAAQKLTPQALAVVVAHLMGRVRYVN